MSRPKRTPSQITAGIIRAAMSKDGTTPQSLAKQMQVHVNTVYSDLRDPDRIPQNRLWLYFTVLGIPVDDALQRIADSFSAMLVQR
jgi:lambda repressor-like predicted transcriptional regulator